MSAERERVATFGRLENGLTDAGDWYHWGPYLSERQWGTVARTTARAARRGSTCPHDHARSRAYRWGEDGLAGFSDIEQRLCLALTLWNGRDPILKERIFGLTGNEGNHGEDAKEYWWYLDALPSHAWNRWRYHYPQREFPYADLVAENGRRGKLDPEYELLDTGVFDDDRYWIVEVHYAKADPHDLLMSISVTNAGPDTETLHVLPTAWYRNTWSWDDAAEKPELRAQLDGRIVTEHPLPRVARARLRRRARRPAVRERDEHERLFGSPATPLPKDGINDHVVDGAASVGGESGTKAAFWHEVTSRPARARRCACVSGRPTDANPWTDFDAVVAERRAEADEFYAELTPAEASEDEALVLRQALAGMLWSKQLYAYDVARWLDGDPTQPAPPASRRSGRNAGWRTFDAFDIMSMPDKWEYPWFAAWDSAFHCVALAHVDPAFAKYQLTLLCREWFQHPNGALAAYEWSFDDVNPPVQAWAALEVFAIDGAHDFDFLSRVFDKLLVNFTWWVNRQDADGSNLFEGGFLGLDNIGPIDRSHLPAGYTLEQSDSTGWMGFYALSMAAIARAPPPDGRPTTDLVLKFLEHFALISDALNTQGLWDDEDGFFYDRLRRPDGSTGREGALDGRHPAAARGGGGARRCAWSGPTRSTSAAPDCSTSARGDRTPQGRGLLLGDVGRGRLLIGVVGLERVLRLFERLFDEEAFLSPYGLRAVSRYHVEHPFQIEIDGNTSRIDYEPAESTTRACSAATRTGAARSGCPSTTWSSAHSRATPASSATTSRSSIRPAPGAHDDGRDRRRPPRPADLALPRRAGRSAAVLRRGRALPDRSGVEGQHPLQRVLPRRQRRGPRRLAPDRLDGSRRRPDRASARRPHSRPSAR